MERQIGDTFDFEGARLHVVEQLNCKNCFFNVNNEDCLLNFNDEVLDGIGKTGHCSCRNDGKSVIFKKLN